MKIQNGTRLILQEDLSASDLSRLRESSIVAMDCEMTGLNPHRDLLCLVQLCDRSGTVTIVRTENWLKAHLLQELLLDPNVTKVFHFAIMDYAFLLKHLNVRLTNVYCTKMASKIARTYSPKHGLADLVAELFDTELDKAQRTTFWCSDRLTAKQLEYAANDVAYLLEVKASLDTILDKKGILPTGISYKDLNSRCQAFIPTLVHLWLNGWDFGMKDPTSVFGR
jgi:ribonuclease D